MKRLRDVTQGPRDDLLLKEGERIEGRSSSDGERERHTHAYKTME